MWTSRRDEEERARPLARLAGCCFVSGAGGGDDIAATAADVWVGTVEGQHPHCRVLSATVATRARVFLEWIESRLASIKSEWFFLCTSRQHYKLLSASRGG